MVPECAEEPLMGGDVGEQSQQQQHFAPASQQVLLGILHCWVLQLQNLVGQTVDMIFFLQANQLK